MMIMDMHVQQRQLMTQHHSRAGADAWGRRRELYLGECQCAAVVMAACGMEPPGVEGASQAALRMLPTQRRAPVFLHTLRAAVPDMLPKPAPCACLNSQ